MTWLLVWPILIPMVTAALCLLAWRHPGLQRGMSLFGLLILFAGGALLLGQVWHHGALALQAGDWPAPFGITLVADLFSALMVLLTAAVGLGTAVYALGDLDSEREGIGFHPLLHALLTGVGGAFVTGDIFNLYVWFEVMVIASFGLIALGRTARQIDGAVKYVVLNLIATTVLLLAIGLLYGVTGTLNMADLGQVVPTHPDRGILVVIGVVFLFAFAMKAAVFPLFFWLPASYHTPAPAVSALFAALLTKVGVYATVRVFTLIFTIGQELTHGIMMAAGAVTMIIGVLGAIAQTDLRRILSFNLVSGIGFIFIGVGLGTALGLAGALYYTIHHIVVMSALFMGAGVIQRLGGENLDRLGGLYLREPWIAVAFFLAAMSLAGVPPLSGFWPKVVVVRASLESESYILAAAVLTGGFLTLYSMAKIWALAFWRDVPAETAPPKTSFETSAETATPATATPATATPAPAVALGFGPLPGTTGIDRRTLMLAPFVVLTALTVVLGLAAEPVLALSERAAEALLSPGGYIGAVLGQEG